MGVSYALGSLLSIDDLLWCASRVGPGDSVWVPETWGMDCFSVMAEVAHRSECRTIGSSILNVYSRSPSAMAMGAATIDALSGGRLILGIGASSPAIVENFHGYAYDRPLQRIRECVQIVRLALGGGRIDYDGQLFKLRGFSLLIKPPRQDIPIYLAAVNPRMVDLAWEVADGVIFYLRPPAEMKETIRRMQQRRRIRTVCPMITAVSEDAEKAYERARRTLAFYVCVAKVYREFLSGHGYARETALIHDEYKKRGLADAHKLIPDPMLRSLTICGTPQECLSRLESFREIGVDEPIIQFNPVGDVRESFRLLVGMFR